MMVCFQVCQGRHRVHDNFVDIPAGERNLKHCLVIFDAK